MELVFDIETTPIPPDRRAFPSTIHCIIAQDVGTGEVIEAGPDEINAMVHYLARADRLIGHDIARFDLPVLEHHYAGFHFDGEIYDTHAVSRLVYASNLYERSIEFQRGAGRDPEARERRLPTKLLDAHKLEAWGYRLGIAKEHAHVDLSFFLQWSKELQDRCRSDVAINARLYEHLQTKAAARGWDRCSEESLLNESQVAYIVGKMERNGVGFDRAGAVALYAQLAEEREKLGAELRAWVTPWYVPDGKVLEPKRSMVRRKDRAWPVYVEAGAEYQKVKRVEFNAGSPQHVAKVLQRDYGWEPKDWLESGHPQTSEAILAGLDYPIIPKLLRYTVVDTRLGQIADGQQAWLKLEHDGRIHGICKPTGTRTSRAAHSRPNLAQVPKVGKPHGAECRALFHPTRPGWVQVGVDAQGLELRMLGHRLAYFDGGAFAKLVLEGDPHTEWMKGTGLFIRDNQKTYSYALLYGAGNEKLGSIVLRDWRMAYEQGLTSKPPPGPRHAEALGEASRSSLLRHFGALQYLLDRCREAKARGWLRGLDGRVLACKTEHGALNDLLQSDGAILVKWAMPLWWRAMEREFGPHGGRWALLLWVHDEWQFECEPAIAERMGQIACDAIHEAGELLAVRCRMDGSAKSGSNWKETH